MPGGGCVSCEMMEGVSGIVVEGDEDVELSEEGLL